MTGILLTYYLSSYRIFHKKIAEMSHRKPKFDEVALGITFPLEELIEEDELNEKLHDFMENVKGALGEPDASLIGYSLYSTLLLYRNCDNETKEKIKETVEKFITSRILSGIINEYQKSNKAVRSELESAIEEYRTLVNEITYGLLDLDYKKIEKQMSGIILHLEFAKLFAEGYYKKTGKGTLLNLVVRVADKLSEGIKNIAENMSLLAREYSKYSKLYHYVDEIKNRYVNQIKKEIKKDKKESKVHGLTLLFCYFLTGEVLEMFR